MSLQAVTFLKASWPYQGGDKVGLPLPQARSLLKREIVMFDEPAIPAPEPGEPPGIPLPDPAGAVTSGSKRRARQE